MFLVYALTNFYPYLFSCIRCFIYLFLNVAFRVSISLWFWRIKSCRFIRAGRPCLRHFQPCTTYCISFSTARLWVQANKGSNQDYNLLSTLTSVYFLSKIKFVNLKIVKPHLCCKLKTCILSYILSWPKL